MFIETGFTICGQNLCRMALTQYILQYVVIILPVCVISTLALLRNLCRSSTVQAYGELTEEKIPNGTGNANE